MATGSGTGTPASTPATTPASLARLLNVYVGLSEIKAAADVTGGTYDALLTRFASHASRLLDAAAGREFFPTLATRYVDGAGGGLLWLAAPALEIREAAVGALGASYGTLEAGSYWCSDGAEMDRSPTQLMGLLAGAWPVGRGTVRLTAVWGWHRNYAAAWQDSQDVVQGTLGSSASTVSVADADGPGQDGTGPRFDVGQLLRIGDEFVGVTAVDAATNALTVVRGCNGTAAADHASGSRIDVWRADELVRQATLIQATRWFKRAQSAFQDVAAAMETGQLTFARKTDPEVEFMLVQAGLRRLSVG